MGERGQQGKASPVRPNPARIANPARIYNALLGGKDNFAVDRSAAKKLTKAEPDLPRNVKSNRRFLGRVVSYLAGTVGIGQFVDIGAGIPWTDNTHEVAQRHNAAARVIYVDSDPVVLAHGRARLASTPQGEIAFVEADLRDPACVLTGVRQHVDFSQPVALMLLYILCALPSADDPYGSVAQLAAATAPGSYLAISHPASDVHAGPAARGAVVYSQVSGRTQTNRSRDQVGRFFTGLELIEPGVVELGQWRPDGSPEPAVSTWGAVGRKSR
jgi:S-adenosyl methyltransferase